MDYKDENVIDRAFSYAQYNLCWMRKLAEVVPKEFIKFVILGKDKRWKEFFWEKIGFYSGGFGEKKKILIHTNAIGEVLASIKLIKLIKERYPDLDIVLSTLNIPAKKRAEEIVGVYKAIFLPYDIPVFIKRLFCKLDPILIIFVEIDLYPNIIKISKEKNVPCVVINHRFFPKRFIFNYVFPVSKEVYYGIDLFCMQSEKDSMELRNFIGERDNEIKVTGNLKFDQEMTVASSSDILKLRNSFIVPSGDKVMVAGSVHPEEEEILIGAFKSILTNMENIFFVIAPRHIERAGFIQSCAQKNGVILIKRTQIDDMDTIDKVNGVILDTFGELANVYSFSDVAFVGGSLVYLGYSFGGHNILEPASFGKPVLFGPHMHNFKSLSELFISEKAGFVVHSKDDIADKVLMLIKDGKSAIYNEFAGNAKRIMKNNIGVSEKTMKSLQPFLDGVNFN